MAHVLPPLRSADDREALRGALVKGVIGAICSDHVPLDADAKVNPFPLTKPGLSGLDTLLPLSLRLVHEGLLSPLQLAARLCTGPATILNVPMPRLAVGETARLTLLDPGVEWTLDAGRLASRSPHTAFTGARFKGRVVAAFMGR
jgi:dihydroorotase